MTLSVASDLGPAESAIFRAVDVAILEAIGKIVGDSSRVN